MNINKQTSFGTRLILNPNDLAIQDNQIGKTIEITRQRLLNDPYPNDVLTITKADPTIPNMVTLRLETPEGEASKHCSSINEALFKLSHILDSLKDQISLDNIW